MISQFFIFFSNTFQSNNVYFSVGSTKRVQCYMCLIPFNKVLAMSDQGTKVVY